jgi:hypothetical protein
MLYIEEKGEGRIMRCIEFWMNNFTHIMVAAYAFVIYPVIFCKYKLSSSKTILLHTISF